MQNFQINCVWSEILFTVPATAIFDIVELNLTHKGQYMGDAIKDLWLQQYASLPSMQIHLI